MLYLVFCLLVGIFPVKTQGASLPHKENFLDLDPEFKDEFGHPLLRSLS